MTWTEHDYYYSDAREPEGRIQFLSDAYDLINHLMVPHIEAYYAAAGRGKPRALMSRLDGTLKVYLVITDMHTGAFAGTPSRFLHLGAAKIIIDRTYLNCLQVKYEDTTAGIPNRLCALIDVATTILVHETGHVVGHHEDFCSGLEGFVRHAVQSSLGYFFVDTHGVLHTEASDCTQTSWACGGDSTSANCSGIALQQQESSAGCSPSA